MKKKLLFLTLTILILFFLTSCTSTCNEPLKCSVQNTLEKIGIKVNIVGEEKANISITPYMNETNTNNDNEDDNTINNTNNTCNLVDETVSYKKCTDIAVCETVTEKITYCEGEKPEVKDECQTKTDCI